MNLFCYIKITISANICRINYSCKTGIFAMHNNAQKLRYYILHKPYNVLSQFSDKEGRRTLMDVAKLPKDVYPVGRLDMDSEGLLLLTNDKRLTDSLLNPKYTHTREYYAFIEGIPTDAGLQHLRTGVEIEGKLTLPAQADILKRPPALPERVPPPRTYETHDYCWLRLTITEGRNRQVRKTTAKIGHPTLRLIRWKIANLSLDGLAAGEYRELTEQELKKLFKLLSL
jgi:23S rRNA pseudouridine2457 synthase